MPVQRNLKRRIIKKYPNRRLYDPAQCRYITLADIRKLIQKRVMLKVIDHESNQDVTRVVLLQVLVEQELAGRPLITRAVLERTIRPR